MNWNLIKYNSFTGKYNMEFDLQLVKENKDGVPVLRFYGWEPHCISLGANQSYQDINSELTNKHNIDVVKRPTGGRAILHAEELTYSVIMPNSEKVSGRGLYEQISLALVHGMQLFSEKLNDVELENVNPNFAKLLKESSGSLCFASTAKSEIKYRGKKLVGSAQRKLGNIILQHGSILAGKSHTKLVDYLNVDENEKSKLLVEMLEKTTEISTITNEPVNLIQLQNCIIKGFENIFDANFVTREHNYSK